MKKRIVVFPISLLVASLSPPLLAKNKTVLDCLVKPEMYINIGSPVKGILKSVLVKKADIVTKGQVLAKLESTVESAKVEVAQQEALMDNQVYAKGIKLAYAKRKSKRIAGLFKENASSAQEQDDAATELTIARTELAQSKLDRKKKQLSLSLTQVELAQKTILSPISGIVVERYLMPGESVLNEPIMQLAKTDPLLIEVVASVNLFGRIQQGMQVEIKPDFPVGTSYQAEVETVDNIIDAASGSFTIRLSIPNPTASLIAGTKCTATFPVFTSTEANTKKTDDDSLPEDIKKLLLE